MSEDNSSPPPFSETQMRWLNRFLPTQPPADPPTTSHQAAGERGPPATGASPRLPLFDPLEAASTAIQAATLALPSLLAPAGMPAQATPGFLTARLPTKLMLKIDNLEFIEIAELLQDAWQTDTTESSAQSLVLRIPRRSTPVTDISVWVECFTLMAAVLAAKYPSKAPDLLMYLRRIVYCARKFEGHAWVTYDRLYRRQASANRSLNWAAEDQALYNEAFAGRAKPTSRCRICLSEHHGTDACPDSTRPLFAHQEPDGQRQAPPQEICRRFNENRCFVRLCKYRHACSTCGAPHPALSSTGHYAYTSHLMQLQSFLPRPEGPTPGPLLGGYSPLQADLFKGALEDRADRRYSDYITNGLAEGFRVGVVSSYINTELSANRLLGPLPSHIARYTHRSRIGVVPKGHNTGKWRLITDLSFPPGFSVNDGISSALCSLSYISVDTAAAVITSLGQGTLLAKIDVQAHPSAPDDRPLLGIEWKAKIFSAVADALEWILRRRGVDHVAHYLDDFIILGAPHSSQCAHSLRIVVDTCAELGVPLALDKCEGPSTCLTFLGIELDTKTRTLRLPRDKLARILDTLETWQEKKVCRRKELESLVGLLHHACKIVRPGRSFLRRMIALLSTANDRHVIRLNRAFRADLAWWRMLAANWNGTGLISQDRITPTVKLYTDAAGSWGCGASWNQQWFQVQWSESATPLPISGKEMLPIIMAAATWGAQWHGQLVACYCDNQAVVATLATRSSKEERLAHLLRCLFYFEARFQFELRGIHIPGAQNQAADALSRNRIDVFFQQVPEADPYPHPIPSRLVEILLSEDIDWLSPLWTKPFSSSTRKA
eukprot:Em0006g684a